RCSTKVPCLCQHSPAPAEWSKESSEGSLSSRELCSARRSGRAAAKRVCRLVSD
ncbi:unnamed protein product, partial [Linum tenue]